MTEMIATLCRDCLMHLPDIPQHKRCPFCGSIRLLSHPELHQLSIAHIDCDSFFATVEKRDHPHLKDKPVVIGGRHRGVVAAACYVARMYGVRSAMPMSQALKLCPDLVVIPPSKDKYGNVGRQVRDLMLELTPLVEPLSVDEAYLDLGHIREQGETTPAHALVQLVQKIESEIGVTASVGLSYNKSLAKLASDLDKPRGFAILGETDAQDYLTDKPVKMIFGVGKAMEKKLASNGIATIGQLRPYDKMELMREYGAIGGQLYHFCRGEDFRKVKPDNEIKSVSNENTLDENLHRFEELCDELHAICQRVCERMEKKQLIGRTITLKLKTSGFKVISRSKQLPYATNDADMLFEISKQLLLPECNGRSFRLIGTGFSQLSPVHEQVPPPPDLFKTPISDEEHKKGLAALRKSIGIEHITTYARKRLL